MGILLGKGKVFGKIIDFYEKVGAIFGIYCNFAFRFSYWKIELKIE